MLDIFAALIEELLGVKKQKQAQPRRVTRQGEGVPGSTATRQYREARRQAPPPESPDTEEPQPFDDMIRQFFGIPEDEPIKVEDMREEPDIPPPPFRPVREPRMEQRPAPRPEPAPPPPSPAKTPIVTPATESAGAPAAAGEYVSGYELGERLRVDPRAARTAFIYAEILGPPAADKF